MGVGSFRPLISRELLEVRQPLWHTAERHFNKESKEKSIKIRQKNNKKRKNKQTKQNKTKQNKTKTKTNKQNFYARKNETTNFRFAPKLCFVARMIALKFHGNGLTGTKVITRKHKKNTISTLLSP